MRKFWRVALHEYTRHVLRRRFLFALLSVPFFIGITVGVGVLLVRMQMDDTPVGYMDSSGVLANPLPPPQVSAPETPVELRPYTDEAAARRALEAGELQAVYLIPPDYRQTRQADLLYLKNPSSSAQDQFESFLLVNLLRDQPAAVSARLTGGSDLTVRSLDGRRSLGSDNFLSFLTPLLAGLALLIGMFTTSGYLMAAVVEEKENRTMEIIVTSVSPVQLMAGKVVGILAVGLTQIAAWLGLAAALIFAFRQGTQAPWLNDIGMEPQVFALLMLIMLPAYVLVSALMAAVGATVTEEREAQQITGLFTLPVVAPYWFTAQIMSNPGGALAQALSWFPLTSPVTLSLRIAFTDVPAWQLALHLMVLIGSAAAALWLAGRAFRLGMLRYGQRLPWRELFGLAARLPGVRSGGKPA